MSEDENAKYPSELAERFQVRFPAGMRERIKAAAEANNRSMNAEIVKRLEDSFYPVPGIKSLKTPAGVVDRPTLEDIVHDSVSQVIGRLSKIGALVADVEVRKSEAADSNQSDDDDPQDPPPTSGGRHAA